MRSPRFVSSLDWEISQIGMPDLPDDREVLEAWDRTSVRESCVYSFKLVKQHGQKSFDLGTTT